ncbi:MAG: hypothetical protein NZ769_11380 [Anaerolineae bacterium]|nr:hypothetical protein [Anaerolineae bacterium]
MSRRQWWVTASIVGAMVALFLLATGGVIAQSPDQNGDEHLVYLPPFQIKEVICADIRR